MLWARKKKKEEKKRCLCVVVLRFTHLCVLVCIGFLLCGIHPNCDPPYTITTTITHHHHTRLDSNRHAQVRELSLKAWRKPDVANKQREEQNHLTQVLPPPTAVILKEEKKDVYDRMHMSSK